ncbi:alpha/beta hydrolase [Rhizobium sp. 18055]|uniref:alpha/beta hydrolase n=1 Tax=Rhizobium sp. 18055 TaxID=2681403 RepID=UPI001358EE99|nr:alpha/beta hydrolase [Rhizobium sp. 18055]
MRDLDNTNQSQVPVAVSPASAHPVLDDVTQEFLDYANGCGPVPTYMTDDGTRRFCAMQFSGPDEFLVMVEDISLPVGPVGSIDVRIVKPGNRPDKLPVLLYFPGCGWISGTRSTHDRFVRQLAASAEVAVLFIQYSHAPAARFPTQIEEGCAVIDYLTGSADIHGLDATRLAVGGDGTGANIAAALCILAKRRKQAPIRFQLLLCPLTSDRMPTESSVAFAAGPWLTKPALDTFIEAYHAEAPPQHDPLAFPLSAEIKDLQGMPPALIITAENDMLRDEGEAYARRLVRAGVDVCATRYLATIHDFLIIDRIAETAAARAAMAQVQSELRRALVHS